MQNAHIFRPSMGQPRSPNLASSGSPSGHASMTPSISPGLPVENSYSADPSGWSTRISTDDDWSPPPSPLRKSTTGGFSWKAPATVVVQTTTQATVKSSVAHRGRRVSMTTTDLDPSNLIRKKSSQIGSMDPTVVSEKNHSSTGIRKKLSYPDSGRPTAGVVLLQSLPHGGRISSRGRGKRRSLN